MATISKATISKAAFLNKATLTRVNRALATAGFSTYPGDDPGTGKRQGSGFVSNLIDYIEPMDRSKHQQILDIISSIR